MRGKAAGLVGGAVFAALGCVAADTAGSVPQLGDARFERPPVRMVVEAAEVVGGGQKPDDAPPSDRAQAVPRDGPSDDAGGADRPSDQVADGRDAPTPDLPPGACDLLRQECPRGSACYRGTAGAHCLSAGQAGESATCMEDPTCDRGLLCIEDLVGGTAFCRRICDPSLGAPCFGSERCRPLPGDPGVGYCAP